MANGPLGGFMPTPAAPSQPPSVKIETTADSRGAFTNFLKNINGAPNPPQAPMGATMPLQMAPSVSEVDIFNEPVGMQFGGEASSPLAGYGDYLAQKIDSTQVEPFIQEVEQMANRRFNLNGGIDSGGQSVFGPLKTFDASQPLMEVAEPLISPSMFQRVPQQPPEDLSRPGDLSRPLETAGEPLLSIFDSGINGFRPFNPPQIQDMMARPFDPLKDKNGILREPMGLRGGPNMFNMIDQRIFNEGFTPGSTQLMGDSPRAFFDGGEVDDFGDVPGDTSDPSIGDTDDRSESDSFQDALDSMDIGSSDDSMFSDDPASATLMGLSYPSAQNYGNRSNIPNLDANTINALKAEINSRNEVSLADRDDLFNKDFTLNDKGKQELDNLNKTALNEVISGDVPASNYISVDDKSGLQDALSLTKSQDEIDQFDIQPSYQNYGLPGVSGLPTVQTAMRSSLAQQQLDALKGLVGDKQPTIGEQLQQNVLADRGRALGPTTFADDLTDFGANVRGQKPTVDTVFDIDTRDTRNFVGDDFESALNLTNRNEADRLAAGQAMGVGTAPNLQNLTSTAMGRGIRPDESMTMVEAGVPSISAPKEFRDPFPNAGIGVIPTLTSLANKFSAYSRGRVLDSIAQKGYTPVYDGDVIVGAKDSFGNLMEGMDPNAPMGSDDNNENPLIIKPKPEEEKEEEDKPPNVIGGGVPVPVPEPVPTVVDSPFGPSSANIQPINFDTGDLNKLIEMLTGVPAKPIVSKKEGGLVSAVDDFLSSFR